MIVDFHSRTSFPQESRTLRSNQLERFFNKKTAGKPVFFEFACSLKSWEH
ncbi:MULTISPECIES: hypothetical protein [unclassified Bacillus (in: firmicutes)]|nr:MULTISPECIES: hypothetical protein [unclassified Bacillus (in: firmicutes)]MBT2617615.1 hypothetical protein [Bacillus sp. ISL-78]MBT2631674.1 hypothetical protein [Bacillus sp. ISL-101]